MHAEPELLGQLTPQREIQLAWKRYKGSIYQPMKARSYSAEFDEGPESCRGG